MATCDPNTVALAGKTFQGLSTRDLMICLVQLTCNLGSGGGGGGNATGVGSPVGVVTPTAIGELYTDQNVPQGLWQATGLTNADWVQIV